MKYQLWSLIFIIQGCNPQTQCHNTTSMCTETKMGTPKSGSHCQFQTSAHSSTTAERQIAVNFRYTGTTERIVPHPVKLYRTHRAQQHHFKCDWIKTQSYSLHLHRAQQGRQDSSKNTHLVSITARLFTEYGLEVWRECLVTDISVKYWDRLILLSPSIRKEIESKRTSFKHLLDTLAYRQME